MPRVCVCCKYRVNVSDVSLYGFPRDNKLLEKWLLALNMKKVSESSRICSRHFKEDDFRYSLVGGKRFLKREAVPCVHLSQEIKDDQLCNSQNPIPKESQLINNIVGEQIMKTALRNSAACELLNITESQVVTDNERDDTYIIRSRDETSKFRSHGCYNKPKTLERLSFPPDSNTLVRKCKRYLYDVQWKEISTSPVQAKIYWEVAIGKIKQQKVTLRTLQQKIKRLEKIRLDLQFQVKESKY